MKLTYAIAVCNESRDLYSLISFLKRVKDTEDEVNVLIDTKHVTPQVLSVLNHFKDDIVVNGTLTMISVRIEISIQVSVPEIIFSY